LFCVNVLLEMSHWLPCRQRTVAKASPDGCNAAFRAAAEGQDIAADVGELALTVRVAVAGPEDDGAAVRRAALVTVPVATATGRVVTGADVGGGVRPVLEVPADDEACAATTEVLGASARAGDVPDGGASAAVGTPALALQPANATAAIRASPHQARARVALGGLPMCIRMATRTK